MHAANGAYNALNRSKANFDSIYELPDPREYFRVLGGLDYVIPELARDVFRAMIAVRQEQDKRKLKILDVGCSYGINSALIRYPIDMQRLMHRYGSREMHMLKSASIIDMDAKYFQSWPSGTDASFVGLDTSAAAITYAVGAGLLDGGVSANLEERAPTEGECKALRGLDLILTTGCVGYVSERSFRQIMKLQDRKNPPWIASFVLRMFSYDSIAEELANFGLVTEKLEGVTFVQRRFHSQDEFQKTLNQLDQQGVDPGGKEADGLLHAELFVSRPAESVKALPIGELVSVTSGGFRRYGRRYAKISRSESKLMI